MFIFIPYSAHFTGVRAQRAEGRTAAVIDLHFDFYIQLLSLHTNAIDGTALWISELSKFEHNQFSVFKRRENWFLKNIPQSRFQANVKVKAYTSPSVVVRTSFKVFRALFHVRPRMRRLSQASQIECKTWIVNMH